MAELSHVIIVGAGFAGLRCAKLLASVPVRITLIDRSNHHLFQPLLYQVATATLSPAEIATPIRSVLRDQRNVEVLMAEVVGVDRIGRTVKFKAPQDESTRELSFDYLVVATGARHAYFGRNEWEQFAPGLKSITDATHIRHKVLLAFEQAEMESNLARRQELLHFILVGGGPTGVEMAGAISELASIALGRDFRRIDPRAAKITLVEAGPRLLGTFPEALSARAQADLERLGVDVRTNCRVTNINEKGVWIGNECLSSRTVIWTAGVEASPAGAWLGVETDRAGRVKVSPTLTIPGDPRLFVIGDTASVTGPEGTPLPGVAPVAMQQGAYVAKAIAARLDGAESAPFVYRDKGSLAAIGRRSAVAAVGTLRLSGFFAWATWLVVHIYYLIGFRNRAIVIAEWAWSYFFSARGARLITSTTETSTEHSQNT